MGWLKQVLNDAKEAKKKWPKWAQESMNTPKLSSLSTTDKIRIAAELDGFKYVKVVGEPEPCCWQLSKNHDKDGTLSAGTPWAVSYIVRNAPDDGDSVVDLRLVPNYPASYDAIIPLIQKQDTETIGIMIGIVQNHFAELQWTATPSQLLDALLVAIGKAEL